jgi:hypothetical protein
MKISVMTPSRGRPKQFRRMAESVFNTAEVCDIEMIVWLDDDDPTLPEYTELCEELGIIYLVGSRNVIHSSRWDRCLVKATGELLFHSNDDCVVGTPGWDKMVVDEFEKYPDRILMVHGDDLGCQRETFGCHPIIHRRWLDTIGYFIPDCFDGEFGDGVVNFIANRIGRRKFLPFVQEHMHHLFGKAEVDQTTLDYQQRQRKQNPAQIFKQREADWIAAADKLQAVMGTPWK